jgi:hypothetical protein
MGLRNLLHFNNEVLLSSSTVVGFLSYYATWMLISSSRTLNLNPRILKNPEFHDPR